MTKQQKRDRQQTEDRILQAVGTILAEQRFGQIGINEIARVAGVDKVLIYRYFGGLSELMQAYAQQGTFWPTTQELVGDDFEVMATMPAGKRGALLLNRYVKGLRSRPETLEIMAWETVGRNELTIALEEHREQQSLDWLNQFSADVDPEIDPHACIAILSAGLMYLAIRGRNVSDFCGVKIDTDKGWQRIEKGVETLLEGLLDSAAKPKRKTQPRKTGKKKTKYKKGKRS